MSLDSTWYFVRHAESEANANGWLAGHSDAALTEKGQHQAKEVAETLRERTLHRVYCSDLLRARQTCAAILEHHAHLPQFRADLRERHLGEWEGKPRLELMRDGSWSRLLSWDLGPPGGESQRQVALRMLAALASIDQPGEILVVSHGTALRTVVGLLDGLDTKEIGKTVLSNAECVVRKVETGRFDALLRHLQHR